MSTESASLIHSPIFFERNRVFRVYRGGRLFHEFFGDPPEDGFYPEEWLASTVKALNKEPTSELEGISQVKDTGIPFTRLMEQYREQLVGRREGFEVLVKLLDSAIRLPVQAHPDKAFARRHFGSPHCKTEMWLVLATRENARIYLGFREGVGRKDLLQAVRASETDPTALPSLLNELLAKPGDVYLIAARMAHAIGAGCLILEVQEPTDFTIQPEAWCGDYHLSAVEMYRGLDEATALECFDFTDLVGSRAISAGRKQLKRFLELPGVTAEHLLTYEDTPDFAVNRYRLQGASYGLGNGPAVFVVTGGAGSIERSGSSRDVSKGDYLFLPACVPDISLATASSLEVIECLPPRGP
jgi:mannose-6-phosphate isomerase